MAGAEKHVVAIKKRLTQLLSDATLASEARKLYPTPEARGKEGREQDPESLSAPRYRPRLPHRCRREARVTTAAAIIRITFTMLMAPHVPLPQDDMGSLSGSG